MTEQRVSPADILSLDGEIDTAEEPLPGRAIDRIPTNESGEPVFEQGAVGDTWQALLDMNEGDSAEAKDTAEQMLRMAEAERDKLAKQKPKTGGTVFEIQARKAEAKKAAAEARQKVDYWQSVVNYEAEQAAEAAAAEAEAKQAEARRAGRSQGRPPGK